MNHRSRTIGLRQDERCERRFAVFVATDNKNAFGKTGLLVIFCQNSVFAINQGFSKIRHRVG